MSHTKVIGHPEYRDSKGVLHPCYQERVELTEDEEAELAISEAIQREKETAFGAELERKESLKASAREKLAALIGLSDEEIGVLGSLGYSL